MQNLSPGTLNCLWGDDFQKILKIFLFFLIFITYFNLNYSIEIQMQSNIQLDTSSLVQFREKSYFLRHFVMSTIQTELIKDVIWC